MPGAVDIRYWGDDMSPPFTRDLIESFNREMTMHRNAGQRGNLPRADYLVDLLAAARTAPMVRVFWSDGPPPARDPISNS